MRNLKQTHLRCFVKVAELGSVTGAAQQLFRSASAISMTVANLESQLGQPLFEAEGKSRLTPFGQYVFDVARDQIARFDHALAGIEAYAKNDFGRVDIAAVPSYATHYLPQLLTQFIALYPNITLRISDNSSEQIHRMLEKGEVDIGVASPSSDEDSGRFQAILEDPIGLVCSTKHALALEEGPIEWEQIASQRFIANGTCHMIRADEFEPMLDGSEIYVQNTTSLLALVSEGVGITTLPRLAVPKERNDVVFKQINNPDLTRTLGLVTPKDRTLSPAAKAFMESIIG